MVYILLNYKLHVQLILHALCLAGSVSIRATVGARRKINHHWLMRSPLTSMYTRYTDEPCSMHFTQSPGAMMPLMPAQSVP